ncbi:6-phosphogluconolactonase [Treponema parvum]|uniref:6-phosphogluconolactonase n=1 Tax=Treponema parvum TaxID=138851 RepID=A0A975IBY8_9SPIR|nr:6-phosphogluconolactonase [Treponema parvum]QTQ11340.1 6-phosphogluconolactonase [Treponema parvum]
MQSNFNVEIFPSRDEMGKAAGKCAERMFINAIKQKNSGIVRAIFAAAPSQNEILAFLAKSKKIDWSKVEAFHMDEYVGLPADAPQGFGNFLDAHIFLKVPFAKVHYLRPAGNPEKNIKAYAAELKKAPIDICLMGIGENGHIAFNDPAVADFHDGETVKIVELDNTCRNQQVHDGCFKQLSDVPKQAVTLTVPTLFKSEHIVCTVPASAKAKAVKATILGPCSEKCPASILRLHPDANMFLDAESGKYVSEFL